MARSKTPPKKKKGSNVERKVEFLFIYFGVVDPEFQPKQKRN